MMTFLVKFQEDDKTIWIRVGSWIELKGKLNQLVTEHKNKVFEWLIRES